MNLELRTRVLEYSLEIEGHINTLLLSHLQILDKTKTKNFGDKAGISFKSKIDLLFDIEVLNKNEHNNLVLQMNFRNKFLHDIESNSFTYVLSRIDSSIRNRLIKFSNTEYPGSENDYKKAFETLHHTNLKMISNKYTLRRESIKNKGEIIGTLLDTNIQMSNLTADFASEIILIIEKSLSQYPKTDSLYEPLMASCVKFSNDHSNLKDTSLEIKQKIGYLKEWITD